MSTTEEPQECAGCGVIAPCTVHVDPPLEVPLCADCTACDEPLETWQARMVANTTKRPTPAKPRHADFPWCDPERDRGPCEECDGSGLVEVDNGDGVVLGVGCPACEGNGRWLCPACVAQSEAEREDARRLYEGSRIDPSLGSYAEQLRDAGRGHLVRDQG